MDRDLIHTIQDAHSLNDDKPCVGIIGNMADGFVVVGPFRNWSHASEVLNNDDYTIMPLVPPVEYLKHNDHEPALADEVTITFSPAKRD
jgi:hypothetical protein